MLVEPGTWGATFLARPGQGGAEDREELISRGFTILEEAPRAGQIVMTGYGPTNSVTNVLNDTRFKYRVHSFFILLPVGVPLTETLIKQWSEVSGVLS